MAFARLGKWAARVNPGKMAYPLRGSLIEATRGTLDEATLAEREAGDYRGLGQALVGALFLGVAALAIPGVGPLAAAGAIAASAVPEAIGIGAALGAIGG